MLDIQTRVAQLRRPKLLIKAARFGIDDYTRSTHLRRIIKGEPPIAPGPTVMQLLDIEAQLNCDRLAHQSEYSVARHIDVLIALIAETEILRATSRPR